MIGSKIKTEKGTFRIIGKYLEDGNTWYITIEESDTKTCKDIIHFRPKDIKILIL